MSTPNLGFNAAVLETANKIYNETGGWVPKVAQQVMGPDYFQYSELVKYCVKLREDEYFTDAVKMLSQNSVFDEVPHNEMDIISKHFFKMKRKFNIGGDYITTDVLANLGLRNINTYVVCRNLEKPYDIYNKGRFLDGSDKYVLKKQSKNDSIIITKRHPFAEKERDLESEQASIEKSEEKPDYYEVKIKNDYVGILNRFVVVVSLKPAVVHCGMSVIVNSAGNKFYIYAEEINGDTKINRKLENRMGQWNNNIIIIGYGFKSSELENTLKKASEYIYKKCDGRFQAYVRPEHSFEEKINWLKETEEDMRAAEANEVMSDSEIDDMFGESSSESENEEFDFSTDEGPMIAGESDDADPFA